MGNTSLTVGSYVFVFNESDIEEVRSTIESGNEQNSVTSTGPMGAYNQDYDGAKKTIVIKGGLTEAATTRVSGYTVTTKLAQKQWLESLINGSQDEITFTDDYESQSIYQKASATPPYNGAFTTTKCMNARATFWRRRGEPGVIYFEITLEVGQAV